MVLTNKEKTILRRLRLIVKGTPIKLTTNEIGNVRISGGGFKPIWLMLTDNVGVGVDVLVKARVKLYKLEKRRIKRRK